MIYHHSEKKMETLKKNFVLLIKAGKWIEDNQEKKEEIQALKQRAKRFIEECMVLGVPELFCWCLVEFPIETKQFLWEQFYNDYN